MNKQKEQIERILRNTFHEMNEEEEAAFDKDIETAIEEAVNDPDADDNLYIMQDNILSVCIQNNLTTREEYEAFTQKKRDEFEVRMQKTLKKFQKKSKE